MRALLPLCVLLVAGCSSSSTAPDPLDGDSPETPGPAWQAGACEVYVGIVDAPESAFNYAGPFTPMPGRMPNTVQAYAMGWSCIDSGGDTDLWIGWTAEGNAGVVLDHVAIENSTDASALRSWNVTVAETEMTLFYSSRAGAFYNEGPGRYDGSEVLSISAPQALYQQDSGKTRFLVVQNGAFLGTINWVFTGAQGQWSGIAAVGTNAFVEASSWNGAGYRWESARREISWVPEAQA